MTGEPTNESPTGGGAFFPGDMPEGLDLIVADIGCARHQMFGYRLGYQQVWPPTTLPAVPLGIEAIKAGELFATLPVGGNASPDAKVLAALSEIKNMVSIACSLKNAKRSGGGGRTEKLTADQRLKALHEEAPIFAEEKTLREVGKLLGCSPSAFDGGDYYENTLKVKRAEVRAAKSIKRAGGPDRGRDENRKVVRDNREHVEACEDTDDRIDATWDERQGGRFLK